MTRRNFPRGARVAIVKRATRGSQIICERCGISCARFDIHHRVMDAMETDKSRKLTADDGELLCAGPDSCHAKETAKQAPVLAKAKARESSHVGARVAKTRKIKSPGFPKSDRPAREPKPMPERRAMFEDK